MALNLYDVIKGPVVTPKAQDILQKFNKITLAVHPQANKPMVAEALKKLFNVDVRDVRIIVRKGKTRKFKRMETTGSLSKRAIVTLKAGQSLDLLSQTGVKPNLAEHQAEQGNSKV